MGWASPLVVRSRFPAMLLGVALAARGLGAPAVQADEETLGVQVTRAVDRGVAYLRAQENADGSFRGEFAKQFPAGQTALALCALAKSQVDAAEPKMRAASDFVRGRPLATTYETAVSILALDALKDPAHDEWIRDAARWLEQKSDLKSGLWSYPRAPVGGRQDLDLSNTQMAALGMWTAERHGFHAARETWERLVRSVPTLRAPTGAFAYATDHGERTPTGSMTVAGMTILALGLAHVSTADRDTPVAARAARALADAWAWLDRRFTAEGNPFGEFALIANWQFYYLYGVERVAALSGRSKIGGREWYPEVARRLLAMQGTDGSWLGTTWDTATVLLVLRKATATSLGQAGAEAFASEAGTKGEAAAIARPSASVPYLTRWLLLGPLPNPDDAGLSSTLLPETRVAPRDGQRQEGLAWVAYHGGASLVSLTAALGAPQHTVSYAFTYLHADRETDVLFWFGHDDGARVWLDGRMVYERHFHEACDTDARSTPLHLTAGAHRLLVKVEEWTGGTGFYARFARADGSDAVEVVPGLLPTPPSPADALRFRPAGRSLEDMLRILPPDPVGALPFDSSRDLDRIVVRGVRPDHPRWFLRPEAHGGQPYPGAVGFLALHPASQTVPAQLLWRLKLPSGAPRAHLTVSGDPYELPTQLCDFLLRVSVFDGAMHPLLERVVSAGPGSPGGWETLDVDLRAFAGKDVLLVIEDAAGGTKSWLNEEAFLDSISIR